MRRVEDIAAMRPLLRGRSLARARAETVPLKALDAIITSMATFAAAYLAIAARWVPGWRPAFLILCAIAMGPVVFRGLAWRYPETRIWDFLASFWLLPSVILGHFTLEPVVTAAHPVLLDPYLAHADLLLFGAHPSYVLGHLAGPWVTEVLMICYYSYFVGPFALAMLLWFRGTRSQYEEFALTLALFFAANFILYALVPAVGPRYYLAGIFEAPLRGVLLTPYLDGLMRTTYFARDCFPSGHTGVTLTVLVVAWRYQRKFFWIFLPVGTGLILGTLVGRFHYGIDLICAVPLMITCLALGRYLHQRGFTAAPDMPHPQSLPTRRPLKA
ncbi:MAG: phosphatase PAP2 family protein [Myxococcaceae bacterium]|nr:phosphatase PAP2 family protein [Myxococcaceae bacterium]